MKAIHKYYKNSNTSELMKSTEYTETFIRDIPVYFYDLHGKEIGQNLSTKGFVEISKKKWDRYKRKAANAM